MAFFSLGLLKSVCMMRLHGTLDACQVRIEIQSRLNAFIVTLEDES